MASVHLRFVPPDAENLATLRIYEATAKEGPFGVIETVTAIGTYPNYIDEYTTANATNISNWFSIEWLDDKGASSDLSPPVQGNVESVVGEIVQRVMMRDPSLNEHVVLQEAETVVSQVYGKDPYDTTISPTYQEFRGMTYLTMAYSYIGGMVTSTSVSGASWTAGLVQMKDAGSSTATTNKMDAIDALLQKAGSDLGISQSRVLQMVDTAIQCGQITSIDQTRLLVEIA